MKLSKPKGVMMIMFLIVLIVISITLIFIADTVNHIRNQVGGIWCDLQITTYDYEQGQPFPFLFEENFPTMDGVEIYNSIVFDNPEKEILNEER